MQTKKLKRYVASMSRMTEKLEFLKIKKELEVEASRQKAEAWKNARIEASKEIAETKDAIIRKRADHVHMNSLEKINLSKRPKFSEKEWHNSSSKVDPRVDELLSMFKKDTGVDLQEEVKKKMIDGNGSKDHSDESN